VRTLEYLFNPDLAIMRELYALALLGGAAVVLMCGVLSVLVVVKRLGFVGQGISHSAFGGIGVATLLGAYGLAPPGSVVEFAVIVAFCIAAALAMAAASDRRSSSADTAIGVCLVGAMAAGAIMVQVGRDWAQQLGRAPDVRTWESILFGSITAISPGEVALAWASALAVLAGVFWWRRPTLFWAFDEESARAFGVPVSFTRNWSMVLLAVAVVTAMKLAGVVLATALLVLPGATALKLSRRLGVVVAWSIFTGLLGLVGGLVLSIEANWPAGPSVCAVLVLAWVAAEVTARLRARPRTAAA
jgi:zinc transport system permease protein